jgi:hypothetical protein
LISSRFRELEPRCGVKTAIGIYQHRCPTFFGTHWDVMVAGESNFRAAYRPWIKGDCLAAFSRKKSEES